MVKKEAAVLRFEWRDIATKVNSSGLKEAELLVRMEI